MKKHTLFLLLGLLFSISSICQEDGFIKTKDGVIHYKTYGSGEPMLIINGGPGFDCEGFSPLAKMLSDKHMTILYDQRGTGKSMLKKADSTTVTMRLMVNDMETIRKHLKIDKWTLLGHSFGGFLAEHYATYYPDSIKAMILSSSGGVDLDILKFLHANVQIRLSKTERDSLSYWNNRIKQGDTSRQTKYNRAKFRASAYLYKKDFIPKVAHRMAFGSYPQIGRLVFKDLYKIKFDCRETLQKFSKPVLIIQGRQDVIGDGPAYETHIALKNSTIVFINKSGHYSWWEQSETYKSEVQKFTSSI